MASGKNSSSGKMAQQLITVAHVIPSTHFGGVEVGIQKALESFGDGIDYRVYRVRLTAKTDGLSIPTKWVGVLVLRCLFGTHPDVVITSLWKSHIFGPLLRALGCVWGAYFHSNCFAHAADRLFSAFAAKSADFTLADSTATAEFIATISNARPKSVPLIFPRKEPGRLAKGAPKDPVFAYVGRFVGVKRIDLVCKLAATIAEEIARSRFLFIGPTGPMLYLVEELRKCFPNRITITGPLPNNDVLLLLREAHFSILMSDNEGLSMATVEALQQGCIPIVRRVGEIRRYCDRGNAVIVEEISDEGLQAVAQQVKVVLSDDALYGSLTRNAQTAFDSTEKYPASFKAAIYAAVGMSGQSTAP